MQIIRNVDKDIKSLSGIYILRNSHNDKVYIGSTSKKFNLRWNNHAHHLMKGNHKNSHLQRCFSKYPDSDWYFEVLEVVEDRNQLQEREKHWIKLFMDKNIPLYNNEKVSFDRYYHSEETKEKISKVKKGTNKGIKPKNYEENRKNWQRPIIEFENGVEVREWSSMTEAAEYHGVDKRYIFNILKGKSKSPRKMPGKMWKYKNDR